MGADDNPRIQMRFHEAFGARDLDTIRGVLADGYVDHLAPEEVGRDGADRTVAFVELPFNAFPDVRSEVLDVPAEDELVAGRSRLTGTHRGEFLGVTASGDAFEIEAGGLDRHDENARCVEHWGHVDDLSPMQRIGAVSVEVTNA